MDATYQVEVPAAKEDASQDGNSVFSSFSVVSNGGEVNFQTNASSFGDGSATADVSYQISDPLTTNFNFQIGGQNGSNNQLVEQGNQLVSGNEDIFQQYSQQPNQFLGQSQQQLSNDLQPVFGNVNVFANESQLATGLNQLNLSGFQTPSLIHFG